MQTAINIFTVLGSIIGIVAFLLTIFSSIHQYNLDKWKKISTILDFNDLEDFCSGVSSGIIYSQQSDKFRLLLRLIRNDSEEIQFKGFAKKRIQKKFLKILELSDRFFDVVHVPKWKLRVGDGEFIERIIDKDYIDRESKSLGDYRRLLEESLGNVTETIERIIILYREIFSLSNRLPHEFLYKRK